MTDLASIAATLADGIDHCLPAWVLRSVEQRVEQATGRPPADDVRAAAIDAGERARQELAPKIRELLAADIDDQKTTPLSMLREAVTYPTMVLEQAHVPPVERDRFAREAFPEDPYDLTPATFADVDPGLADAGLAWGAAKAWEHKRRHGGRS